MFFNGYFYIMIGIYLSRINHGNKEVSCICLWCNYFLKSQRKFFQIFWVAVTLLCLEMETWFLRRSYRKSLYLHSFHGKFFSSSSSRGVTSFIFFWLLFWTKKKLEVCTGQFLGIVSPLSSQLWNYGILRAFMRFFDFPSGL